MMMEIKLMEMVVVQFAQWKLAQSSVVMVLRRILKNVTMETMSALMVAVKIVWRKFVEMDAKMVTKSAMMEIMWMGIFAPINAFLMFVEIIGWILMSNAMIIMCIVVMVAAQTVAPKHVAME